MVAQGVLEYMGGHQDDKLAEIADLLLPNGRLVASYMNFDHRRKYVWHAHNNVQPIEGLRRSLEKHFAIERSFPTSYNWHHDDPSQPLVRFANMHLNLTVPYIAPKLAVQFLFVCRPLASGRRV